MSLTISIVAFVSSVISFTYALIVAKRIQKRRESLEFLLNNIDKKKEEYRKGFYNYVRNQHKHKSMTKLRLIAKALNLKFDTDTTRNQLVRLITEEIVEHNEVLEGEKGEKLSKASGFDKNR